MIATGPISIAGFAATTSVGYTLESTLAAMGAGLSNFIETSINDLFGRPTVAGRLFDSEAPRSERLAPLARHGLDDLKPLLSRVTTAQVPLLLGLPSDLDAEELRSMRAVLSDLPLFLPEVVWFANGRSSAFSALARATELIVNGSHQVVVVGGIDALCAPQFIRQLVNDKRILGPCTEGTIPGEAAAFAVLVKSDHAIANSPNAVRLEAVILHQAETPFMQLDRVSGDALAAIFHRLRQHSPRRVDRIIAAHSGEGYFGRSFAHAYLRAADIMPEPLEVALIADCVGDVGAAAGILGLALGAYLMVKDARPGERRTLVYSESDAGELGAAVIAGAPTAWQRGAVVETTASRG